MSSRINDRLSRERDRYAPPREREDARNNGRTSSPPSKSRYSERPSAMPGSFDQDPDDIVAPTYEVRAPADASKRSSYYGPPPPVSAPTVQPRYSTTTVTPYPQDQYSRVENGATGKQSRDRPAVRFPDAPDSDSDSDDALAYGDASSATRPRKTSSASYQSQYPGQRGSDRYIPQPDRGSVEQPYRTITYAPAGKEDAGRSRTAQYAPTPTAKDDVRSARSYSYAAPDGREVRPSVRPYPYASTPERSDFAGKPYSTDVPAQYRTSEQAPSRDSLHRTNTDLDYYHKGAQIVEVAPGQEGRTSGSNRTRHMSLQSYSLDGGPNFPPPPITEGLGAGNRSDLLAVGGLRPDQHGGGGAGGLPPPSPMLEAYRGTWQSVSPMALAIRPNDESDLSDLEPLDGLSSGGGKKKTYNDKLSREAEDQKEKERGKAKSSSKDKDREKSKSKDKEKEKEKKHVVVYNAESDAKKLKSALGHSKVDAEAVIDVLPPLSHDQIWDLRKEYKKQVKIQGKGINLPKHLKMKLSGNFGKVVYVTGLGRWESEGYWANFWYQSHGSRRELLIESLMGRTNSEIRYIKDEFRDKRYSDSLTKCMEKELKMDKFRSAVMIVLDERRQEEQDVLPAEYKLRDVDMLQRAITSRQGGETAILEIILLRSDSHLREVLKTYQAMHGDNFARVALRKSNNLVGEVIAHVLNGVINKPARDAILLNHAIRDVAEHNKEDDLRYELLISRLVRYHWDKLHLVRVKREYYEKYHKHLQEDIEDATKGDFREFMCELCET